MTRPRRPSSSPALTVLLAAFAMASWATAACSGDYKGEFIPFPEVEAHFHSRDAGTAAQHGSEALVDFFYSAQYRQQWRLLTEFVIGEDERDLERFVVGHVDAEGNQIWVGRYHTGLGQWNHKFHHGAYLQPTIHRPGIIEWEDEGGVIPAHATGVTLGGVGAFNGQGLEYSVGLGLGPGLGNEGKLIAYNLLDASDGQHDVALTAKLSTHLNDDPFDDTGVFAGYITIPSQAANLHKVQQTVLGAYTNYSVNAFLWRATLFYVGNALSFDNGGDRGESFTYAYVEPEYTYNTLWTLYARWEKSFGAKNDLYIQQIPSFVIERALVGARYQLNGSQALKLELANMEQFGQRFLSVEGQWSAALP